MERVVTNVMDRSDRRAFERVKGMLFLRLVAGVAAVAIILTAQAGRGAFDSTLYPVYVTLVALTLVNLGYLLVTKRVKNVRRFAAVQIYLDLFFAGVLVYVTGAGDSNITVLYFACILAASILLGRGQGIIVAALATVSLALMHTLTFLSDRYGFQLPWSMSRPEGAVTGLYAEMASLMAQAMAYYLVAILAGKLAQGLSGVKMLNEKILESISDGLLAIDSDRKLRAINREAAHLLALPMSAARPGLSLDDALAGSPNADVLREIFKGERPAVSSVTLTAADGRETPVAVTSSAMRDERGRTVGLVVMLIDLTERKRLEEALARADKMEMVGQLAASIAHEIRNPLACIRGSAQEIRSEVVEDAASSKLLDLIVRESDRINAIVSEFLNFSRMRRPALTRTNLTPALADVVTMLESRRSSDNVRADLDAPGDVWCLGDVELLKQVFLNLGINAMDAMPDGGSLTVRVRLQEASWATEFPGRWGTQAIVEFVDEGLGMTDEVRRQLFQPFFSTKSRGTGLGLCIVRRIVEAHRGAIDVESTPGKGSTFRVTLEGYQPSERAVNHV